MAVLTWRNVDAPNFSGAVDGIRTASMLLNNATDTARQGIRDFTKAREDAGDRALLDYVQGIQDPTAMTQALATDPRLRELRQRASVEAIRGLDSRPGDLIARALQQENLSKEQFNNNRYRTGVESLDANGAAINRALVAERAGQTMSAEDLAALQTMRPDVFSKVLGDINTQADSGQGRRQIAQNMAQSAGRYNMDIRNDTEARQAQALVLAIAPNAPTSSDAAALLQQSGASPAVQALALRNLQGLGYSGMFAPWTGGASAPAAGASSSGFAAAIPYTETNNYVSTIAGQAGNLNGLTIDQKLERLTPLVLNKESGNRRFDASGNLIQGPVTRSGDRAQGEMQVMPKTVRDPGYGVTPAKDNSPDEIARVGRDYLRAMLNKYDGNVEHALAAYNAGPGTVDRWLKEGIGQQDPAAALLQNAQSRAANATRANNAITNVNERLGQNRGNSIAASLEEAVGDTKLSEDQAIQKLIKDGTFAKEDRGTLLTAMRYMTDRGVAPAIAGEILRRNIVEGDTWFGSQLRRMFTKDTLGLSNGIRLDDSRAKEMMDQYLNGDTSLQATQDRALESDRGVIQSLQQQYQAAESQYQSFLNAARLNPGYAPYVQRYRLARDQALDALNAASANQENSPRMNPQFRQTVAQPAPVAVTAAGQPVQSADGPGLPYQDQMQVMMDAYRNRGNRTR